jgi:L-alanine-DL-glutamate epimerase-like enolase superfamily enzyme
MDAIDFAARNGLGVVIHNQTLGIADAMMVHLAAARYRSLGHAIELFGNVMYEDDLITRPLDFDEGKVRVPDGPGWAVQLDQAALERYATAPTLVLKL